LVLDRSAHVYGLVMLGVTVLASLFAFGGRITQLEGGVLVAVFVLYVASVLVVIHRGWLRPPDDDDDDDEAEALAEGSALRPLAVLVMGLVVISGGAELVVQGAAHIAERIGLSEYAIGATVVAIGTTLPDKAISLIGGWRGQGGVVTANATGSNIFLLSLVLGLAALPGGAGLAVPPTVAHVDVPLLLAMTLLITLLFRRPSLHRRAGVGLLILYVAYVVYALVQGRVMRASTNTCAPRRRLVARRSPTPMGSSASTCGFNALCTLGGTEPGGLRTGARIRIVRLIALLQRLHALGQLAKLVDPYDRTAQRRHGRGRARLQLPVIRPLQRLHELVQHVAQFLRRLLLELRHVASGVATQLPTLFPFLGKRRIVIETIA
jgi:hypothetical protein